MNQVSLSFSILKHNVPLEHSLVDLQQIYSFIYSGNRRTRLNKTKLLTPQNANTVNTSCELNKMSKWWTPLCLSAGQDGWSYKSSLQGIVLIVCALTISKCPVTCPYGWFIGISLGIRLQRVILKKKLTLWLSSDKVILLQKIKSTSIEYFRKVNVIRFPSLKVDYHR